MLNARRRCACRAYGFRAHRLDRRPDKAKPPSGTLWFRWRQCLTRALSPLACIKFAYLTRPIRQIPSPAHIAMKGRIRPILHPTDMTVLNGIDINVIHMPSVIFFITDGMFPESRLPDMALRQRSGKHFFNVPPATGIIGIPLRQGPDAVHMLW